MNELIGEMLAQHYINLPFISKAAGCVQEIIKPSKKASNGTIPVVNHVYRKNEDNGISCDIAKRYHDVVPSSSETGIVYFEDFGAKAIEERRAHTVWRGRLKLVCWLNMDKIGEDNEVGDIAMALMHHCPNYLAQQGKFLGGFASVSELLPKRPSPFDKYAYDEKATQFLMYPYQHHSMMVQYECNVAEGCATNIIVNPIVC